MKSIVFLIIIVFQFSYSIAQNRSNIWELSSSEILDFKHKQDLSEVNFTNGYADTSVVFRQMSFFLTNSSICDTLGNLLFYSNGQWVANKLHDSLLNCKEFNAGWATDHFYNGGGLGFVQGMIIIPHPDSSFLYDLFYITSEKSIKYKNNFYSQPFHLSHSVIDLRLDNGLGAITTKNEYLIKDTLVEGKIAACKAANGRDWWIIDHKWNSQTFYIWLLTPTGINGPYSQNIGSKILNDFGFGQSAFSPDGNQFTLESNYDYNMDYYHFDRCTGTLSDWQTFHFQADTNNFLGTSFSPSSRFLYRTSVFNVIQYDTKKSDVFNSPDTVATWDGSFAPDQTWFFLMQQASDNRIYIATNEGDSVLHYINFPDSIGKACDVIQHGVILPYFNNESVPNFPNYDLSPLGNFAADAGPNDTIVKGESVQLGIPSVAGVKYQWKANSTLNDTTIAQPNATPDTTTTYYVTFTDTSTFSSCNVREDTVTVFVKIATSAHSAIRPAQIAFRVSHNPANQWLNIVYHSNDDAMFELYNQFGENVAKVSLFHYFKNRLLDVSSLPEGMYEYKIEQRNLMIQSGKIAVIK